MASEIQNLVSEGWPDLMRLNSQIDSSLDLPPIEKNENTILAGNLVYHYFAGGLSMHYGSTTELKNDTRSTEIPSGISFNVIFEGKVDFSLTGKRNQLRTSQGADSMYCTTLTLKRPEVLTRFLKKNMQVKKVNLFVEERWLKARCTCPEDKVFISRLMKNHADVLHWKPSKRLLNSLRTLIKESAQEKEKGPLRKVQDEQVAIELCSNLLKEFSQHLLKVTPRVLKKVAPVKAKPRKLGHGFKEELDRCLKESNKLPAIASLMNMSTSTLQRHCKQTLGVTVKEYSRMHKLDMAKQALINQSISVGEAAYLAGYQHPSNFITAFKKYFGISPGVLVKAHH